MSNRFFQQMSASKPTLARVENITMLRRLGLTAGLKLCLDAGDAASYSAGQPWLDRSGGGYDFNRGTTSGADATDPTFTGSAGGLSSGEYWALDGGDLFTYDSANETWMDNIHKAGALFSAVVWANPAAGAQALFGTSGNNAASIGAQVTINTTNGNVNFQIADGSGVLALNSSSNLGAAAGTWQMFAVSVNEAANTCIRLRNSTSGSGAGAYATPSSSAATNVMQLAAAGNAQIIMPNNSRLAQVMMWEGVALSLANLNAIFNATRGRYGV